MKRLLFFLSIVYTGQISAQTKSDTISKKESWSLGIVAGSTYSGSSAPNQPAGGLNSGLVARIYFKKNFISTGLLFNQYKYYLGYSLALPNGYPNKFYNSFFHIYSVPLYFNFQSQGGKNKYYIGLGAEALYWRERIGLTPGDLRIKYWLGAKVGITYKYNRRCSILLEVTLKETTIISNYPGIINFHSYSYNPYLIIGINAGLLYNF